MEPRKPTTPIRGNSLLKRTVPLPFSQASTNKSTDSLRPSHHANSTGSAFKNPWPSANPPGWAELARSPFPLSWAKTELATHPKARPIKVVKPDWGRAQLDALSTVLDLDAAPPIIGTWLGHASVLVEMPLHNPAPHPEGPPSGSRSIHLLFDPIFSARAGPTQWTGPKRLRPAPCDVADLPGVDLVFISHNHYDHLDATTIESLLLTFPRARYFVPLGLKSWFIDIGAAPELIYELDWWETSSFGPEAFGHSLAFDAADEAKVRITCVPAQHNSGRMGTDLGNTLWCGWVIERFPSSRPGADGSEPSKESRRGAIYHAGDTGYRSSPTSVAICPAFTEIGSRLGPFDLSFLPIWRGGTLGFISNFGLRLSHNDVPATLHATPADAVEIHREVGSRVSVGVHFGTFIGSENESYEAVIEFAEACVEGGVGGLEDNEVVGEKGRAGTVDIGASIVVEIG